MRRPRRPTTHMVKDRTQLRALASPLRLEIVGLFESGHELSVSEIAARLGRPVASMYFHVRKLERVRLLVESGSRGQGRAAEAVYRTIADRIAVPLDPRRPVSVATAVKTLRSILRQAGREFEALAHTGAVSHGLVVGRRQRVWLSEADAAEARRRLDAFEAFLVSASKQSAGSEHVWTSLLVPLIKTQSAAVPGRSGAERRRHP